VDTRKSPTTSATGIDPRVIAPARNYGEQVCAATLYHRRRRARLKALKEAADA
jgi:hypothetical protein